MGSCARELAQQKSHFVSKSVTFAHDTSALQPDLSALISQFYKARLNIFSISGEIFLCTWGRRKAGSGRCWLKRRYSSDVHPICGHSPELASGVGFTPFFRERHFGFATIRNITKCVFTDFFRCRHAAAPSDF